MLAHALDQLRHRRRAGALMSPEELAAKRARIEACRAVGERAYDLMYEARERSELSWQTEVATDAFREAYRIADEIGASEDALAMMERLRHVKAVARQLA